MLKFEIPVCILISYVYKYCNFLKIDKGNLLSINRGRINYINSNRRITAQFFSTNIFPNDRHKAKWEPHIAARWVPREQQIFNQKQNNVGQVPRV